MEIPTGPVLRRLIVPHVVLLLIAVGAVTLATLSGADRRTILKTAIVAWGLGGAFITLLSLRYAKTELSETVELFRRALPSPLPDGIRPGDALEPLAETFARLIAQSQEDQAQLRTIISSMTDALLATDHRQRILLTNEAAAELLDVPADAKGKALWDVLPVEEILGAVTEVSLTGQRKTISLAHGDGKQLEVTACRLPLRPAGFVIIARDVTEAARYEELRKEFVANVSHELRTPLTLISGFVETLRDGAFDDRERAQQYLATVHKHSERLANLIED